MSRSKLSWMVLKPQKKFSAIRYHRYLYIYCACITYILCMYVNLDSQHRVLMRRSVLHKACERSKVKPKCIHTHLILYIKSYITHDVLYTQYYTSFTEVKCTCIYNVQTIFITFIPASGSSSSLLLSHVGELCSEVWLSARISTPVS